MADKTTKPKKQASAQAKGRAKKEKLDQIDFRYKDTKFYSGRDGSSAYLNSKNSKVANVHKLNESATQGKTTTVRSGAKSSHKYITPYTNSKTKKQSYIK